MFARERRLIRRLTLPSKLAYACQDFSPQGIPGIGTFSTWRAAPRRSRLGCCRRLVIDYSCETRFSSSIKADSS